MVKAVGEFLRSFQVCRTSDSEVMRDVLTRVYGATGFELKQPTQLNARANYVQLPDVCLGFCAYGTEAAVDFPEGGFARFQLALTGTATTRIAGETTEINKRQICVTSPDMANRIQFGADYEQIVVRVGKDALRRRLTALLGSEPRSAPEFSAAVRSDDPQVKSLLALVRFVGDQLAMPGQQPPDLMLRELESAIATGFLTALPHSLSHLFAEQPADLSSLHVRRVEEYIDAHWSEPLTVEVLAQVTGVGSRSIFHAFRRRRGYTPLAYLKAVRLRQARKLLMDPAGHAFVSGVAFQCGFNNLGHFAADYREMFGELPSMTLQRAR